jgi:hypothetical protein
MRRGPRYDGLTATVVPVGLIIGIGAESPGSTPDFDIEIRIVHRAGEAAAAAGAQTRDTPLAVSCAAGGRAALGAWTPRR